MYYKQTESYDPNDYWYFLILVPLGVCLLLSCCCCKQERPTPTMTTTQQPLPQTTVIVIESPGSELSIGYSSTGLRSL